MIIKNNEETVRYTLNSLLPLDASILIGDIGCKDNTAKICKEYGAKINRIYLNDNLSQVRNNLLESSNSKWIMRIEPWETILNGYELIKEVLVGPQMAFKLNIIQGDVITKEIRIWHKNNKLKFENPIFETIKGKSKNISACIAVGPKNNLDLNLELVEKWRERCPLATEPIYYTAFSHLNNKNWDAYLNWAGLYLHQEKNETIPVCMMHYYCSMVNCYIKKDHQKAIQYLLPCIAKQPTMAEFWCLMGDIYYDIKDYDRAKSFYENAQILGSKRIKDDDWPLEISKYKDYPNKMIECCDKIKNSSRMYAAKAY